MHLISGTRVGPYEILEAIGALGMGEIESKRDPGVDECTLRGAIATRCVVQN